MKKSIIGLKIIVALLVLVLLSAASTVTAQTPSPIDIQVTAGFDNYCKENAWMPLQIIVENSGVDFEGVIQVQVEGNSEAEYVFPLVIASGTSKQINTQLFVHTYNPAMILRLVDSSNGNNVVQAQQLNPTCTTTRDYLIAVVGEDASAYTILNQINPHNGSTFISSFPADELPEKAIGLEALNLLILSNVDSTQLSANQVEAIHAWVRGGGHLLLTGGTLWQTSLAGFVNLLPQEIQTADTTTVIEAFSSIDPLFALESVVVSRGPLLEDAQSLLAEDGAPLVSRRQVGSGVVTLLNFDPTSSSFRGWLQLEAFYRQILNSSNLISLTKNNFDHWSYISDAVTQFSSLALPPIWLVCGYLFVYIIVIGPINYIVLAQINRREWAWVTIPSVILVFTLATVFAGVGFRGSSANLNQLAIVTVYPGEEFSEVQGVVGLFSPSRQTYHIETLPGFNLHQLPNRYYNYSSTDWEFTSQPGKADRGVTRVDTGGIAVLGLEGSIPTPQIVPALELSYQQGQLVLTGTLSNFSGIDLSDMVLLHPGGDGFEQIGDLRDGESSSIEIVLDDVGFSVQGVALPFDPVSTNFAPDYYYFEQTPYVDQLLGYDYFGNSTLRQRSNILQAAPYDNQGFMLLAWTEETPFEIALEENQGDLLETSLYMVHLKPTVSADLTTISLPPSMFRWYMVDYLGGYYGSAYNMRLSANESISIGYRLSSGIQFKEVTALTLHLAGASGLSQFDLTISLWDYTENRWHPQDISDWGDWQIQNPDQYLGPNQQILIQLSDQSPNNYYDIERADFTLAVEP